MELLLLTVDPDVGLVLPALSMLSHGVRSAAPEVAAFLDAGPCDAVFVDARWDLVGARSLCQLLGATGLDVPVVVVIGEGGLVALSVEWGFDEVLLPTAGPAEVGARLGLLAARRATQSTPRRGSALVLGELVIDAASYTVWLRGRALELTYKEFELLKFLAQHAGRVFTRAQLLAEVWGYDFFGGTRTVDVHVRRLRAKLGPEHEQLIATVRNVGYKFVRPVRLMSSRQRTGQDHPANADTTSSVEPTTDSPDRLPAGHRQRQYQRGTGSAPYLTALPAPGDRPACEGW
jgi:DNA-binding response OmpR family regulator